MVHMFVSTQSLHYEQDVTQGQFLNWVHLVWINFSFFWTSCPTQDKESSLIYYSPIAERVVSNRWFPAFLGLLKSSLNVIIIIKSCRQHGYPWPSLATFPYRSSPPAGLLGYILCPHIAAVCKFGLVVLLLLGHMWGSIVVRHLRARLCFSSSVRRVWLVWPV